jgi:hypothetical protein
LFNALANDPDFAGVDFSELVISNGGGMAVQQATAEKWLKITGCPSSKATACRRPHRWPPATASTTPRVHRHDRPADLLDRHRDPR